MSVEYSFVKQVDQISLTDEILSTLGTAITSVNVTDSLIKVITPRKLTPAQEKKLRATIINHDPLFRLNASQLSDRVAWGLEVIKQFRLFTLSIPDDQGLGLLENLIDVKTTLELGMLATSGFLLETKPPNDLLDAVLPSGITLRQRFLNMILQEGPPL